MEGGAAVRDGDSDDVSVARAVVHDGDLPRRERRALHGVDPAEASLADTLSVADSLRVRVRLQQPRRAYVVPRASHGISIPYPRTAEEMRPLDEAALRRVLDDQ